MSSITSVTGVSGSGKTSLIKGVLYPALMRHFDKPIQTKTGEYGSLTGDLDSITDVELIDQNPIGRSSRSNPVSYLKAYDLIRDLFAKQPLSKQRGYKPGVFSFNVPGGRCDLCEGEGEEIVEMQFMADLHIRCESCGGKRFKDEILEVTYLGKSIHDVLQLTVDEAVTFFSDHDKLSEKLKALQDVGLGYVQLGQSSNTLSGGEAQRVKLAFFLTKGQSAGSTLFIFDEPTTGLHFHDINKLMKAFNSLVELGHSIVVIEHNLDVIKCSDYVIDLGPEGGIMGGQVLAQGTPEDIAGNKDSVTGQFLKDKLG
jgi:excinuclease ABC subunit A